ncbi:6-phosphofructokinase [Serpentinicella alkaliphila]|uniref:ATP-dependent 6-phosphofructokinase n=1 Tax=Serpentinicella alkaliphila TaxID=1734049 RepID=A0A4R2UFS7_9FIRM|nr:6-phosphofructokinase [Serpentinicella alkaliphila]QUH25702.1 6-phosphofructokinase [Serpentinicella alkaliphila]TCQ06583.1 6-phosphofructokinase [Serpentinicella alkaliphila]
MKKIGVLTSGGDAPGMNAAIRAVVRNGVYRGCEIIGIKRGYEGLLNGQYTEMNLSSVADIIHRGGTILGTARSEEFKTNGGRNKALEFIKKVGLEGLIVIGGDGSFKGAQELCKLGVPTVGVPGTIDNDLNYTDYTIGFDTAMNTVLDAISKIRDTSTSHERTNIIEVMGRDCGDIALYSGLAGGAESIILPEISLDIEKICEKILNGIKRGKRHSIIMLAEGAGSAIDLAKSIQDITGIETRTTILGYIQRGGSPTAFDRILASKMGAKAVDILLDGEENKVVGVNGNDIIAKDIDMALKTEKRFDKSAYDLADILSR